MAWLQISPGQSVTLRIVDGVLHERITHWVDRTMKDCTGAGCAFCAAGATPKKKFWLSCQVAGVDTTWEFTGSVLDQLNALLPGADKRAGAVVTVQRIGEGLATRYVVTGAAGAGSVAGPTAASGGFDHSGVVVALLAALAEKIPPGSAAVEEIVEGVKAVLGSEEYLDMVSGHVSGWVMGALTGDSVWRGGLVGAIARQIEDGLAESHGGVPEGVL